MTHLIDRRTCGVFIISATPFSADGAIDWPSLDRLLEYYVETGVDGLTLLGMMGEADKLAPEERCAVFDRVMSRLHGRLPVIVGVSDAGLANLAAMARYVMDKGAAGVMIAPSRGTPREDRVIGYFHQVCEAIGTGVPVAYQDFPQATGVPISVRSILELSRDLPQIVMLKHEESPGLAKISAIRDAEKKGSPRLSVLCGNGGIYLPQELMRGADGAMTGFAYPEALVHTVRLHAEGRDDAAEDLYDCYLPILRLEQQLVVGLAIRKHILMRRGVIASAALRAPAPTLSAVDVAEIDRLMVRTEQKLKDL